LASLEHPFKFQRVSRLGSVTAQHSSKQSNPAKCDCTVRTSPTGDDVRRYGRCAGETGSADPRHRHDGHVVGCLAGGPREALCRRGVPRQTVVLAVSTWSTTSDRRPHVHHVRSSLCGRGVPRQTVVLAHHERPSTGVYTVQLVR